MKKYIYFYYLDREVDETWNEASCNAHSMKQALQLAIFNHKDIFLIYEDKDEDMRGYF